MCILYSFFPFTVSSLLMGKYSEERLDVLVKSDAGNVINITKVSADY